MVTSCSKCALRDAELASERARSAALAKELEETRQQRNEALKLIELQKADLARYKQVVHGQPQPNQPERAPEEQMQLAFARVLAAITDKKLVEQLQAAEEQAKANTAKTKEPRVGHGRRNLDLTNLPVIEECITPPEVLAANGVGWELIGRETSDRVGFRPSMYFCLRISREKWRLVAAIASPVAMVGAPAATMDSQTTTIEAQPAMVDAQPAMNSQAATTDGQTATISAHDVGARTSRSCFPPTSPCVLEVGTIITAPIPEHVWPNVMADPSLIAEIAHAKYDYLLPLNRQERWTRNRGFAIPRSTQCEWIRGAYEYVKRVVDAMHAESIASAHCLATDATGAPVRAPGACRDWHVFVFIGDTGHITFRHVRRHTSDAIDGLLAGFKGCLLADASSIYDRLAKLGVVLVACWAHVRRYIWKALDTDRELALEGLAIIKRLFAVDRAARDIAMPERTTYRAERAKPVLDLFDQWVARVRDRVEPRGRLAAAIKYYENQRTELRRFLEDGRLPVDNNRSERQLRHLVGGRDNWKFFESESGLEWYTAFRSLFASCEANDINPHEYLEPLLRLLPHWPQQRVLELSPKYWRRTLEQLDDRYRAIINPSWKRAAEPAPSVVAA